MIRQERSGRERGAEELHEMKAAFGDDDEVRDVITGETIDLGEV